MIRVVVEADGFSLELGTARLGDTTFDHEGKVVLAIDEQISESLADKKLDVKVTGEEHELILLEQLEE